MLPNSLFSYMIYGFAVVHHISLVLICLLLCSLFCPVASKIRYLQEYHNRVQHNIYPVPSGTDIANTLKYFSQTLLR